MHPKTNSYRLLYLASVISAFGWLVMGYQMIVISGAIIFIKSKIALNLRQEEILISSTILFAVFGAISGWPIAKGYGRKKAIVTATIFLIISSFFLAIATRYWHLLIGRSVLGLGVGLMSMSVPIYISEIVPPNIRGSCVCLINLFYFIGVFLAYIVDWSFAFDGAWHLMFAIGSILSILTLFLLKFIPETPYWLIAKGKHEDAKAVLMTMRRPFDVEGELELIEDHFNSDKDLKLNSKPIRKTLILGLLLALFMEITGVDAVLYYAPTIIKLSGQTTTLSAVSVGLCIGITALVFSFIAVVLVDWVGRRKLLLFGIAAMALGLFFIGLIFRHYCFCLLHRILMFCSFTIFTAGFVIGLGTIGWLLISELFPYKVRTAGVSVSITIKWLFNLIVASFFLTSINEFGRPDIFWLYSAISVIALVFVFFFIPETAGKSLYAIEKNLIEVHNAKHA